MQPSRTAPTYQHKHNKGLYRITYQAPAGARRQGIPHDDKTDLVNLSKVGGRLGAPEFIVTSEADFQSNFVEVDLLSTEPATAEPQQPKE